MYTKPEAELIADGLRKAGKDVRVLKAPGGWQVMSGEKVKADGSLDEALRNANMADYVRVGQKLDYGIEVTKVNRRSFLDQRNNAWSFVGLRAEAGGKWSFTVMKSSGNQSLHFWPKGVKQDSVEEDCDDPKMDAAAGSFRVGVTVSDPTHTMASKRKELTQKTLRTSATSAAEAKDKAAAYYKRQGFKVHETWIIEEEKMDASGDDELVPAKIPGSKEPPKEYKIPPKPKKADGDASFPFIKVHRTDKPGKTRISLV